MLRKEYITIFQDANWQSDCNSEEFLIFFFILLYISLLSYLIILL